MVVRPSSIKVTTSSLSNASWSLYKKNGRNKMIMNQHLTALQFRHSILERKIANENKRPLPNYLVLKQLKQKKLELKETMQLYLA